MIQHYGVDVSSNNPHPINWSALYGYLWAKGGGGQPFAIVKVNEGSYYINPDAQVDIAAAHAAGFAVGGYLMDSGASAPAAELKLYRSIAGALPMLDDDEIPGGLATAAYIAHLQELVAEQPAVQYLNQSEVAQGYSQGTGLWLAQYNNQPGITAYPCLIHQYTSSGIVPGCAGEFDLNLFRGNEAQFTSLFQTAPAPTPPPIITYPTEGDIIIMGLTSGCKDDGAVDLFIRQTFNDFSTKGLTQDELTLFRAMYHLPSAQKFGGVAGYGENPSVLYYSIVDYIEAVKKSLRPEKVGSV